MPFTEQLITGLEITMPHSEYYNQLVGRIQEFTRINGKPPTKLFLTKVDECDILKFTYEDIGEMSGKIWREGARAIGNKVFGLEIVWDSPETKLE
jgi:hypothetical protein